MRSLEAKAMKKLLLMGRMNDVMKNLSDYLQDHFRVQVCLENTENTLAMIRVLEPDVVLILLIGIYEFDEAIFNVLSNEYPDTPIITIGTQGEFDNFKAFTKNLPIDNLIRPIDNEKVLEKINKKLEKENVIGTVNSSLVSKKVLIVDDDALTLRNLKMALDSMYDVTIANSGMKAIASIGKQRPDIILLDYEMPICDGRQTLEMIRADREIADIPVVFLTGVSDREHIEAVVSLKPAGYLLKPVTMEDLEDTIDKVLKEQMGE